MCECACGVCGDGDGDGTIGGLSLSFPPNPHVCVSRLTSTQGAEQRQQGRGVEVATVEGRVELSIRDERLQQSVKLTGLKVRGWVAA